jgi:hypothetical protein
LEGNVPDLGDQASAQSRLETLFPILPDIPILTLTIVALGLK